MGNNQSLVSVIIPCFNHGKYIDQAVDSVLNQTYQDFEIIIIDDGSTDEFTISHLKNYSKSKTTLYHTENEGVCAARNYGISKSNGDYILPLDADDYIMPTFLEKAIKYVSDFDIIYSNTICFGDESKELILPDFSIENELKQNLIVNTALYSKENWKNVGGYNVEMKKGWEDWDFWLKLIEKGAKVFNIDESLFFYRIIQNSRNRIFSKSEESELEQQIITNHIELYRKYFPEPLTLLRELDSLRTEKESFEKYKQQIHNSVSYKLGDFILVPIKFFKKLFK